MIIQHAQGWDDQRDTQLLSEDPVFQLACSNQHSTTPLTQQQPSQPTLPRLLNLLAQDANLTALHNGLLNLAMWRLSSTRGGKPLSLIMLDMDGLPDRNLWQSGGYRLQPLCWLHALLTPIASTAETGDMVDGLLRKDNSGNNTRTGQGIPELTGSISSLSLE